ncbi:cytochrome c biogenesis protein CcdA [Armatimonas sp.]|uniref:cytochrome c biogenesis protein CcdA n=1 Tax=Armatimonas sp. TaxID=1872638 RepID=UPI00374D3EE4
MRRLLGTLLVSFIAVSAVFATPQKPSFLAKVAPSPAHPGEFVTVTVTAKIPKGTHLYSVAADESLFTPTSMTVEGTGITAAGKPTESKTEPFYSSVDKVTVGVHENEATFTQAISIASDAAPRSVLLKVAVRYQACDESGCLPPATEMLKLAPLAIEAGALRPELSKAPISPFAGQEGVAVSAVGGGNTPVESAPTSLLTFILTAFGAGLLALITPCVFPMIPVTFSYFTKLATAKGNDSAAVVQKMIVKLATLYCLGIVVSFTAFGLIMAVTVGAAGATKFAANPWVNLGFATLFVVFGLALLEVFELKLPGKVMSLTGSGRKTGGYLGVFLLGLTFVIASFTCAAPFVGTVMVLAANGKEFFRPILGMALFATALALPFFLLAIFPSLLKKMPKSGDWLTTIKGAMGFLELAAAVKFLSNADLVWNWKLLSSPMCLLLYGLALLAGGVWLLGKLSIGFNTPQGNPTPARRIWSGVFIAVAIYFFYGVSGRPLHPLLAGFLPPPDYGFGNGKKLEGELEWGSDLEKAKAEAKETGKKVLIDFTGHT